MEEDDIAAIDLDLVVVPSREMMSGKIPGREIDSGVIKDLERFQLSRPGIEVFLVAVTACFRPIAAKCEALLLPARDASLRFRRRPEGYPADIETPVELGIVVQRLREPMFDQPDIGTVGG